MRRVRGAYGFASGKKVRLRRRRKTHAHAPTRSSIGAWRSSTMVCVQAYQAQLARERGALSASTITIAMMMIGAALLSVPSDAGPRTALLSMAGPLLAGMTTVWYLWRQVKRYDERIVKLRRISA